jgi:hypothetical protein
MSWLKRILTLKTQQPEVRSSPTPAKKRPMMPTVKFDSSLVTKKVKIDLRENIEQLGDIPRKRVREIYDAALAMIEAGGNMPLLYNVLLELDGMSAGRAGEITRTLLSKARALTEQESRTRLGVTQATWMYANAPCMVNPSHPTDADRKQDAAHQAANGKRFDIGKGLLIDGKWTLPGRGVGCKCVSRSVIPGLESFSSE